MRHVKIILCHSCMTIIDIILNFFVLVFHITIAVVVVFFFFNFFPSKRQAFNQHL